MSATIEGQSPERAQHGAVLHRDSVSGERVQFIQQSDVATGTGTVGAGDFLYFNIGLTVFFPQTSSQIADWDHVVAWNYSEFYVDNTSDPPDNNYFWRAGGSLTGGQLEMDLDHIARFSMAEGDSHNDYYFIRNNDASDHTVTVFSTYKFIHSPGTEV